MSEPELRERLVEYGRSLFERGYGCGSSGNLSVRLADDSLLLTPTNASLGSLRGGELTRLASDGRLVSGREPSKESWMHLAIYEARPECRAVVHLHSTYAVALSCLERLDESNALPPLTAYSLMRFGRVAALPYFRPGDLSSAGLIKDTVKNHSAFLLRNHGPVVWGRDVAQAMAAAEELEETCRLFFLLKDLPHRLLTAAQIDEIQRVFGAPHQ